MHMAGRPSAFIGIAKPKEYDGYDGGDSGGSVVVVEVVRGGKRLMASTSRKHEVARMVEVVCLVHVFVNSTQQVSWLGVPLPGLGCV
jgi:hypothetical protein